MLSCIILSVKNGHKSSSLPSMATGWAIMVKYCLSLQRADIAEAFGITQGSPAQKSYDVSSLPRANQKQIREGRERGHTQ